MNRGKVPTDIDYRERIDDKILNDLRKKIYEYLCRKHIPNSQVFWQNMQKVSGLYVEKLKEKINAKMQSRGEHTDRQTGQVIKEEIAIDTVFMKYDNDGNLLGFVDEIMELILSQLGHELIHSAARYKDEDGKICSGLRNDKDTRGINEGFTQLITENIFGLPVSPNTDGYTDLKKMAKIMQITFGENEILNAYFNHDGSLERDCNQMATNPFFYKNLCHMMEIIKISRRKSKSESPLEASYINLMRGFRDMTYSSIVLNIIIPKMRSLPPKEQQVYIRDIMDAVKDNGEISRKIKNMIKYYGALDATEIENENKRLNKEFQKKEGMFDYYTKIDEEHSWKNYMTVDSHGNAHPIINESATLRSTIEDVVFSKYFMEERCIIYYDEDDVDRITDYRKLESFKEYVKNFLKNGKDHATLEFKPTDSIVTKKSYIAALKTMAISNGYIILNSINECNDRDTTTLEFIQSPGENHAVTFDELHRIYSRFMLEPKEDKMGTIEYRARNRKTGELVPDRSVQIMTEFASLWADAAGVKQMQSDTVPGETYAFNGSARVVFDKLGAIISEQLNETRRIRYRKNS